MNIYVASSWRNLIQPTVVRALRELGHTVYDFKNPVPGDHGFSWSQCTDVPRPWTAAHFREVLRHPLALDGFSKDMKALRDAHITVLVLPCGRSAHLELGYATGAGQKTYVLLDDPVSEPELMYHMNSQICISLDELVKDIGQMGKHPPLCVCQDCN